jgi:hypothetical protein
MPLKTVEEHNEEVRTARFLAQYTGIACPECDSEMKWTGAAMMSAPPRRGVSCACGYKGSVL